MSNQRTPSVLVVGLDEGLRDEFHDAVSRFKGGSPSLRFVFDRRQALELARTRRPDLVCVEMDGSARELVRFAEDLRVAAPSTLLTATYEPSALGDADESAVLIACVRAGIQDFFRRPVSPPDLERVVLGLGSGASEPEPATGRVVSFISNKGGSGKSTLAVNVACDLARQKSRVLLLDASLQLGTCASMLDMEPRPSLADVVNELDRLDETLIRELASTHPETGLDVIAAPADPAAAAEIGEDALARVISVARRAYDIVVVDTFPLVDGLVLAILDASDQIFVVIQCSVPNVMGAKGLLDLLERLRFSRAQRRLVLNNTHARYAGSLRPADVARRLGEDVDFVVPFSKGVIVSMNAGRPFVVSRGVRLGFGRAVRGIASSVRNATPSMGRIRSSEARSASEPEGDSA